MTAAAPVPPQQGAEPELFIVADVAHRGLTLVTLRTDEQPLPFTAGQRVRVVADGVPASGLTEQLATAVEAIEQEHDPLCMAVLRGKACTCGVAAPDHQTAPAADRLSTALAAPGVERIRDFYAVGPVQRAAVESFADALLGSKTAARQLSVLASFAHEVVLGAYPEAELPAKAKLALERAGFPTLQSVLALSSPTSKTAEPAEANNMEKN